MSTKQSRRNSTRIAPVVRLSDLELQKWPFYRKLRHRMRTMAREGAKLWKRPRWTVVSQDGHIIDSGILAGGK